MTETSALIGDTAVEVSFQSGWKVNGRKPNVHVVSHADGISLFGPNTLHFKPVDLLDRATAADVGRAGTIVAPMPGAVKDVMVAQGDSVRQGDTLMILEAMKMEHRLTAPFDGVVAELNATAGGQMADGTVLAVVEKAEV